MKHQKQYYLRWRHAVGTYDPYDEDLADDGEDWGLPGVPKRVKKMELRKKADKALENLYHRLFTDRLETELGIDINVPLREKYSRLMEVETEFSRFEVIKLRGYYRQSSINGQCQKISLYARHRRSLSLSRAASKSSAEDQGWQGEDRRNGRIEPARAWGYR